MADRLKLSLIDLMGRHKGVADIVKLCGQACEENEILHAQLDAAEEILSTLALGHSKGIEDKANAYFLSKEKRLVYE